MTADRPPPDPSSRGVGYRAALEAEADGEDMDKWFAGIDQRRMELIDASGR